MVCTYCGAPTRVTNSRFQKRINQTWRRRRCLKCGNDFTTHEIADLGSIMMVRYSDHKLSPFSREKLFISIYSSCKHRKSAIQDADSLTQTIISRLVGHINSGILERSAIVSVTANTLELFDQASALIYTAYYVAQ